MSRIKNFKKVFYELFILTLGILIALLINGWKEDYNNAKYLKKTFVSINEEIKENIREIELIIPFQDSLESSIYLNLNDSISISDIIIDFGGFKSPVIKASGWKSIVNKNIHLIDYSKISKLSEIEEVNKEIKYKTQKIIEFIYENAEVGAGQRKQTFSIMILDLIISEEELISIMHDFLKAK